MIPRGPQGELRALKRYVSELEVHFIKSYLKKAPALAAPSRDETLRAGAYVVLAHGALENFIEGLALWVLNRAVSNWTNRKKLSRCTGSILLYHVAERMEAANHVTVFDNLRLSLDSAKQSQSIAIRDNNGIDLQHVRELFYPLGVDVPNDPVLAASIDMVVSMRHYWAHQYRFGATILKSAQDTKTAVDDCLLFAERLSAEVASARP